MFKSTNGEGEALGIQVVVGRKTAWWQGAASFPEKIACLIRPLRRFLMRNTGLTVCDLRRVDPVAVVKGLRWAYGLADLPFATRLVRNIGTRASAVLGVAAGLCDGGQNFRFGFYKSQVRSPTARPWVAVSRAIAWTGCGRTGAVITSADRDESLTLRGAHSAACAS